MKLGILLLYSIEVEWRFDRNGDNNLHNYVFVLLLYHIFNIPIIGLFIYFYFGLVPFQIPVSSLEQNIKEHVNSGSSAQIGKSWENRG